MSRLLRLFSLLVVVSTLSPSLAAEPTHPKRRSTKHKRVAPKPKPQPELAAPGNVPPGAQLTPDRVIEAPQAPGPDSPADRVTVPARDVTRKREPDVQPPYPTGYDPGRNMQPTTGFSPSGQSVVP